MAIVTLRQPPESGPATIGRALNDLMVQDQRLGGAQMALSRPLPLYRIGLDDLHGPDSLDKAQFFGWRYLLEDDAQTAAAADLGAGKDGVARFAGLARNEQADFLLCAAHLAQHIAADLPTDCEARILVVPSLYVSTLWLTAAPPIFIPFVDGADAIRDRADVKVRPQLMRELEARAKDARALRSTITDGPAVTHHR